MATLYSVILVFYTFFFITLVWLRGEVDFAQETSTTSLSIVEECASGSVDHVVVLGAWRRLNGSLSLAFEERIRHGAAMALLCGARNIVFTGGLNDSVMALEYYQSLTNAADQLFPETFVGGLVPQLQQRAVALRTQLSMYPTTSLEEAADKLTIHLPRTLVENRSRTTWENAVESFAILEELARRNPAEESICGSSIVVVTSDFHVKRSKVFFNKIAASAFSVQTCADMIAGGPETPPRISFSWRNDDIFEWSSFEFIPLETIKIPPRLASLPLIPESLKFICSVVGANWAHWRGSVRMTMLSMRLQSLIREIPAIAKALALGQIGWWDLFWFG